MGHEHRHDHASHEKSRSARAGGATEHSAHGDTHASSDVIYTCPMHPQIRQLGPGNCPICGMTLEPLVAIEDTGPSPELVDMTRRFWIGLALTAPVLVLEMGGHFFNLHQLHRAADVELDSARSWRRRSCFGPAGRSFTRRAVARHTQSQHVHAHRHGHWGRLALQHRRDVGTVTVSAGVSRHGRLGPDLFRGGGGHHRARSAWPSA